MLPLHPMDAAAGGAVGTCHSRATSCGQARSGAVRRGQSRSTTVRRSRDAPLSRSLTEPGVVCAPSLPRTAALMNGLLGLHPSMIAEWGVQGWPLSSNWRRGWQAGRTVSRGTLSKVCLLSPTRPRGRRCSLAGPRLRRRDYCAPWGTWSSGFLWCELFHGC